MLKFNAYLPLSALWRLEGEHSVSTLQLWSPNDQKWPDVVRGARVCVIRNQLDKLCVKKLWFCNVFKLRQASTALTNGARLWSSQPPPSCIKKDSQVCIVLFVTEHSLPGLRWQGRQLSTSIHSLYISVSLIACWKKSNAR